MNPRRFIGLGAAAAMSAVILLVPTVSQAQPSTTASSATSATLGPRAQRACLRIPNLQLRTDNLITRLNADASTVGSLAWLKQEITKAQNANRTQVVTVLQNRLAVRTQTVTVLEQRKAELSKLSAKCATYTAGT